MKLKMIERERFFLILSVCFILLTLITIVFSLMIIILIVYHWKSQLRSITNLLTCNSCVTLVYHSIATMMQIPFFWTSHSRSTILCQIQAFVYLSSATSICYSYFIQAITRYFITILYKRRILLTFRTSWILIIINWMISGVLPGLMFISPLAYQYESESRMCLMTSQVFVSAFIGMITAFCFPLSIVILLYTLILRHTTRIRRNSTAFTIIRLKRNMKVFRNILLFTLIFAIGGTPYFISVLIQSKSSIPWPMYLLSILFISVSTTLESLALFFTNTEVKTLFYTMIHKQQQTINPSIVTYNARLIPPSNQINDIRLLPTIKNLVVSTI